MENEVQEKPKIARTREALRMIAEIEAHGITQYRIWQDTKITNNTMFYWRKGFWNTSPKLLKKLAKYHQEVLDGKVKPE